MQQLDAANKIQLVVLFSTMGMLIVAVSNMVAGALSDKPPSRFGRRAIWIVGGAFAFMLSMIGASFSKGIVMLLIFWMIGQVAMNFIVVPMVAWIDYAPERQKGLASFAYGGFGYGSR
ncbi:hypothetical protein [Pectinatus brassicae]|uniref:MFS family permease n=1 Tax=Pectinatus brassicae TaxID=862415 RepID=A0A840UKQ0_9FIRM|nr:hypothetical protein [Pectinatus brassicae]MBB5337589.1 MFS family permease [Pectinatus brassicae]